MIILFSNPQKNMLKGALVSLAGNLTWALSPYTARDRLEEGGMAVLGALLGTLGPAAAERLGSSRGDPLQTLEREYLTDYDEILDVIWDRLEPADRQSSTPARVNRRVWEIMFPPLPYEASVADLARAIVSLLERQER